MAKLKPQLDTLKVESFEVGSMARGGGTVRGFVGNTTACDSVRLCKLKLADTDAGVDSCDYRCTVSAEYTLCGCPGDDTWDVLC